MRVVVVLLVVLLNACPPHDVHVLHERQNWDGFRFDELCVWRFQQPRTMRCLRMRRDGSFVTDADLERMKGR